MPSQSAVTFCLSPTRRPLAMSIYATMEGLSRPASAFPIAHADSPRSLDCPK